MNKEKTKDDGKMSAAIRESKMAWDEFFKNKPKPKNKLDEKKQFEDYINWYNNERKQSDTGKTPAEMYNEVYGEEPPSPVNLSEKPSRVMSFEWDENYKEPDEILDEAKDLIMNGKYEVALKLINNVLEIVYDDPEVLYLKIGALTPLGKIDEAENILKEIDKKYGKSSDWYLSKAAVSFFTGNIARALEYSKDAVQNDPKNWDALIQYAECLHIAGKDSSKYEDMAERIDKKRFDKFKKKFWVSRKEFAETMMLPNALDNVMALLEDEKFEEAQSNIEILLRLDAPKDIRIMLSGLDIEYYIVKGDFATASNKVEALIKINKNNPHAYFYKAQLLMKQNKLNYALNEIDICLEKVENLKMPIPHPDFYFLKSIILKKMDNDEYTYYEEKAKQLMNGLSKLFR